MATDRVGKTPAVLLVDPKWDHNVGAAQRAASCYGVSQLWWTGNRVPLERSTKRRRLPREERMKGYEDVLLTNTDYPYDYFPLDTVPVAVEIRRGAEPLNTFVHPERALYVFGPEDGGLTRVHLQECHRVVYIPTRHCLNLATAITTVLYDRALKRDEMHHPGDWEQRGWASQDDLARVVQT